MNKKGLMERLERFLENRVEANGTGWAPVSNKEMSELGEIINNIIVAKYERDVDGDLPVEFRLTNRHTHGRNNYFDVPYDHKDMDGAFDAALANLSMATQQVNMLALIKRREECERRKKGT